MPLSPEEFQAQYDRVRNTAPENCVFCYLKDRIDTDIRSKVSDIVYQDEHTMAFVPVDQANNCYGRVLVVPLQHYINKEKTPQNLRMAVENTEILMSQAQRKTFNNTSHFSWTNTDYPQQTIGHYHTHVAPTYGATHIEILMADYTERSVEERAEIAERIKAHL